MGDVFALPTYQVVLIQKYVDKVLSSLDDGGHVEPGGLDRAQIDLRSLVSFTVSCSLLEGMAVPPSATSAAGPRSANAGCIV